MPLSFLWQTLDFANADHAILISAGSVIIKVVAKC